MDAAGGAAAAAIPAAAVPPPQPQPATPDELELARYGAPRDTPPALASKFLELAHSKAPEIVFDPTWGLKFAHPEDSSQFSRFGWLVKPIISSERHLGVQCLLAKGDGTPCLKKTQLSYLSRGRYEVKFGNHLDHLEREHKRMLLEPAFVKGGVLLQAEDAHAAPAGAKRGRVSSGGGGGGVDGVHGGFDKFDVANYKKDLLEMVLADARPLSIGDSAGFRVFARRRGFPYVSARTLNNYFHEQYNDLVIAPRKRAVVEARFSTQVACGAVTLKLIACPQASADGWDGNGHTFESLVMHYAKVVRGPPVREKPTGAAAFLASHVEFKPPFYTFFLQLPRKPPQKPSFAA